MKIPRLLLVLAALFVGAISPTLRAQTIPKGNLAVDLVSFATLPKSANKAARVNVLATTPDGRIFVNDQRGPLYTITPDGRTVIPYLNLAAFVPLLSDDSERGFQGFAFHPDFAKPGTAGYGKFYTMASQSDTSNPATFGPGVAEAGRDHDEVLLEWTAADPAAATFTPANGAQPFREVMRIVRPNSNHNAGYISFNPTAGNSPDRLNLYIGTGDSGGGGDPFRLAQSPGKIYGAILRINPLLPAATDPNRSTNGQYSIPADNPFATGSNTLREKYLTGFRNPQRFTWDQANGRLFVADIGQNTYEEIDVAQPGANYGWNAREGSFVYNSDGSTGANVRGDAAATGFTYPIAEYRHFGSKGNAVTAGPVYRGSLIPSLAGRLLFSDFPTGTPYTIDANTLPGGGSDAITELRLRVNGAELSFLDIIHQVNATATRADLRFGTDLADGIYFLNKQDGVIRRVVTLPPVEPPAAVPVGVGVDTASISRAAHGKALVTFTRTTSDLSADLVVTYKLAGTAVNGRDYKLLPGTRTIPAGKASASIKVKARAQGDNGKVKVAVVAGNGYTPDPAAKKVKIAITD